MKYLILTKGASTLVDDDDYKELNKHRWQLCARGYAARDITVNGKKTKIYLHRVINKTPDGYDTDHISQDKLDNRKVNLRTVTRSQNMSNCSQKNNTSGYRGVSLDKRCGRWTARAKVDGKYKSLGMFSSPEEASRAYQEAVNLRFSQGV